MTVRLVKIAECDCTEQVQLTTEGIMRKVIAAPILAGLIGMAALAAPLAAHAADTPTTFEVTGGSLSISAPTGSVDLGGYTLGTSTSDISSLLGTVTVVDQRAALSGSWTAGVTSTDFTTGTAGTDGTFPASQTVPAADINYSPGAASAPVGSATYTPGTAGALGNTTALTAMSTSNEVGSGGVSWDPTLTVTLPAQVVAGTYSGTITHSVA